MAEFKATFKWDVSDAISGLKALQREAKETVHVLKQVESINKRVENVDDYERYLGNLLDCTDAYGLSERYINRQLYDAIHMSKFPHITIHYKHGDGATTSAMAAIKTFNLLVYITRLNYVANNLRALFQCDRIYAVDQPLRGVNPIYTAGVILLDNVTLDELAQVYTLQDNQRIITLHGHE